VTTGAVLYLHGFASSAGSTKARFFAEQFRAHGIPFECPDFNEPAFETLTLTRMLGQLDDALAATADRGPATVIGSSLGGALAVLGASQFGARIGRLVLLAPAVMFAKEGHHLLTSERCDEWRRLGRLPFFHYAYGAERMLNVSFYEDSLRYNPFDAMFTQPTLIFQGRHDTSVDVRTVEAFARPRANVSLVVLDDDHQLVTSLASIWTRVAAFLGVT
jgi:hypothetical protein